MAQAAEHAGSSLGLHSDDTHGGLEGLDGIRHTTGQSAAADGHNHGVDVGIIVDDLHAHAALSGNHQFVVEGVDESHAFLLVELQRPAISIVVHTLDQAYLGSHGSRGLHLADGCSCRHADERRQSVALRCQRHTLGMVSGRAGYDAALLLLIGELRNLEACTAHLERAGHLQVFGFQKDIAKRIDFAGGDERRATHHVAQFGISLIDKVECQHDIGFYFYKCIGKLQR